MKFWQKNWRIILIPELNSTTFYKDYESLAYLATEKQTAFRSTYLRHYCKPSFFKLNWENKSHLFGSNLYIYVYQIINAYQTVFGPILVKRSGEF